MGRSQVQPGLGAVGTRPSGSCRDECRDHAGIRGSVPGNAEPGNVREPGRLCQLWSVTGTAASPAASTCGAGQDLAAGEDLAARSRAGGAPLSRPDCAWDPRRARLMQWAGLGWLRHGGGGRGERDYSRCNHPKFSELSFPCIHRPSPDASQPGTSTVIPLQGQSCPGGLRGPSSSRWSGREEGARILLDPLLAVPEALEAPRGCRGASSFHVPAFSRRDDGRMERWRGKRSLAIPRKSRCPQQDAWGAGMSRPALGREIAAPEGKRVPGSARGASCSPHPAGIIPHIPAPNPWPPPALREPSLA